MRVHHIGLPVGNIDDAVHSYEQLGFQVVKQLKLHDEIIVFVEKDGWKIELIESPVPESPHICFQVENERQAPREAKWIEGPITVQGWRSYFYQLGENTIEFLKIEE